MVHKRTLGRTGLEVTEIGLGALELGRNWRYWDQTGDQAHPDEQDAERLLNAALDMGCNFIDTAAAYSLSEERIGKAIAHRRDEYILATKCGEWFTEGKGSIYDYSAEATRKFIDESLRKLQTDRIDLLQIHSGSVEVVQKGETLSAMKEAQQAGKVRFIGLSCNADAAIAAMETGEYDTIQVSYNVLYREMESRVFPIAQEKNIGVIIKDPLASGRILANPESLPENQREQFQAIQEKLKALVPGDEATPTLAALALRFVLSHPAVSTVIAGTRRVEHLQANLAVADGKGLPGNLAEAIRAVTA